MAQAGRSAFSRAVKVVGVTGAMVALSVFGVMRSTGGSGTGGGLRARLVAAGHPARTLRLYYTPPVLVRSGEQVVIPTDTVCATEEGDPCLADVEIWARAGDEAWHSARAADRSNPRFDLTQVASLAGSSRAVSFALRATDGAGSFAAIGAPRGDAALRFYVTDSMSSATMPPIPFGEVRRGEPVLSLAWGTGPHKAGLELGNESDTLGPMSFDVDAEGRILLLDSLQQRLAVFDHGTLSAEVALDGLPFDVAAGDDGSAFVLSRSEGSLQVRRVSGSGSVSAPALLGEGVPGELRVAGGRAYANLLPTDAWTEVPAPGEELGISPGVDPGLPLPGGRELLRVARSDSVRLGTVLGGQVTDAVELRSTANIGDVALAEPDGSGGYWVVVHVWQQEPTADQYQVVDVRGGRVFTTFAVSAQQFATAPPLNRFRLVGGSLYQMTSSPEGLQIVRYGLGGAS